MNEFSFYLQQGTTHILDLGGMDHLLFVITLCAIYRLEDWKKILILITAFTLGHSLTLALSSLGMLKINQDLVETLIPITILLTSISNIIQKKTPQRTVSINYLLAMGFGLIHGMGFSNFFRSMMMGIRDGGILGPLLSFNLGVEIGQIIIVVCFMIVLFLFTRISQVNHREWNLYVSGAGGGIATTMIIENLWL